MDKYDVIIVGAGTAGSLTAKTAAKAGLKVCLIDRKPREEIGEKICGDAIGKHHFDDLGLAYPKGDELHSRILGVKIHSPDLQSVFQVKGEKLYGFILNRRLFGQRLLNDAVDAGANLLTSTMMVDPILKNGFVSSVCAKNMNTGKTTELQSRVVVDASGFSAVLRKKLPPELAVDTHVENEDVEACYREIRSVANNDYASEYCEIYLDQTISPGGYYWVFPEGAGKVNVGLGVCMSKGFPNPKNRLYNEVLSQSMFKGSVLIKGGAWYVPTRRPLDSMVSNGLILVGDSACQVNPIHGGGMGPSMMGGKIAGEVIARALETDDVSREGLWQYNARYMKVYGAKQAGLDIFRLFLLQSVTNEDMNYGIKYRLITEEDVLKVSMGENLRLNVTDKAKRALRGLGALSMLVRLRNAANLLKKMKALYMNYPTSPEGFEVWRTETHKLMNEARERLSRKTHK